MRLKSPPTQDGQSSSRASSIVSSTGNSENVCCDDPEVLTATVDNCVTPSSTESPMTEESSEQQSNDTDIDSIVCGQSTLSDSFFSNSSTSFSSNFTSVSQTLNDPSVVVSSALLAKIESLEAENKCLKKKLSTKQQPFRIEDIAHDDKKIHFYAGFRSYEILVAFFEFLGPAVDQLQYWGTQQCQSRQRKRSSKLSPLNQLFMFLIKLKLNLLEEDIAHRFGVSKSLVSKYTITWMCFVYQTLKEVEWMPSVQQV